MPCLLGDGALIHVIVLVERDEHEPQQELQLPDRDGIAYALHLQLLPELAHLEGESLPIPFLRDSDLEGVASEVRWVLTDVPSIPRSS